MTCLCLLLHRPAGEQLSVAEEAERLHRQCSRAPVSKMPCSKTPGAGFPRFYLAVYMRA